MVFDQAFAESLQAFGLIFIESGGKNQLFDSAKRRLCKCFGGRQGFEQSRCGFVDLLICALGAENYSKGKFIGLIVMKGTVYFAVGFFQPFVGSLNERFKFGIGYQAFFSRRALRS